MRKILLGLLLAGVSSVVSLGQTPTITGVTPDPAMYSSQITIHGSGFGAAQGSGIAYLYNSATPVQAQVVSWDQSNNEQCLSLLIHDNCTGGS